MKKKELTEVTVEQMKYDITEIILQYTGVELYHTTAINKIMSAIIEEVKK